VKPFASVDAFRASLDDDQLKIVDRLCAMVRGCADGVVERVKWNAPSYGIGDNDRITLGVSPKGIVRVILHRGAAKQDNQAFSFEAPAGLVTWPDRDRGVMQFADAATLDRWEIDVKSIFHRWMILA
jgi:hypothetical protein